MDAGGMVAVLSLVWFLAGSILFFCFGLFAFVINPFTTDNLFEPEEYRTAVLLWHLPMIWGWVPAAYRSLRGRPRPWRSAKWTIILGAIIGPLLFLAGMLMARIFMQASASV